MVHTTIPPGLRFGSNVSRMRDRPAAVARDGDTFTYRFPKGKIMTILRWIAACGVAVAAFMLPLLAYS
jgi:hypothetical protein